MENSIPTNSRLIKEIHYLQAFEIDLHVMGIIDQREKSGDEELFSINKELTEQIAESVRAMINERKSKLITS